MRVVQAPKLSIVHAACSPRSSTPVALESFSETIGAFGAVALVATLLAVRPRGGADSIDDLTRRGMRDALRFNQPMASATEALPSSFTPATECITSEGKALLAHVGDPQFAQAWQQVVSTLGKAQPAASTLQGRIDQLRDLGHRRRVLADCFACQIEHSFREQGLRLLDGAATIAPKAPLPLEASTLVRVSQHFPGQSARQVRAFVTESAPSADDALVGRFARLQAAQLTMGCIQFGYFLSQVFRGAADLDDERVLTPEEARALQREIRRSTRLTRTEAAWAVGSRRAGGFFAVERTPEDTPEGTQVSNDSSAGYEDLREFTVGVQVVTSAQQDEFFAASGERADEAAGEAAGLSQGDEDPDGAASAVGRLPESLPTADLVRFNAAGLQALLSESCLYGWHLWGAEAAARAVLLDALDGTMGASEQVQLQVGRGSERRRQAGAWMGDALLEPPHHSDRDQGWPPQGTA